MAKVFVSYSRKDIVVAKRLTAELQKCEMDFWIDWEGIPPTVDWWKEIEKGIEEADIFLFLISSDSSASKVCGQEIDTAVKNAKRIIPLVVRDIKGDEAPKQLSHLNWIFFRESDDFDAALTKLLTAIQTDYEWAATHRRLQIKALDWERNNKDSGFLLRGADLLDAEQDLAINTSKDPHPTDLQREFVYKSRKATDKQRRITTWISVAAAIALAALAAFGFYQAGLANRQTKIALSGKLAAQAEILLDKDLQKALLLGVESNRILEKNNLPIDPLARGTLLDVVNTNLQVFQFLSPGEQTKDVEFSPDGRSLASAHGSKIIFWNISSGKPINKIEMEDVLQIYSIAFHPDSRIIAAGACIEMSKNGFECQKGKIILWNIETQQQIDHLFVDHMTFENKISFSPDGKSIVSISTLALREASIVIWEMKTGEVFDVPISQETIVMEMAFSPDGNILAIGDSLWDLEKNRKMKWLGEENGFAGRVSFSPDGKLLSTTSIFPSPKTNFWDIATGELLDTFSGGVLLGSSYQMDRQFTSNSGEITVWESFWDSSNRQEVNKIPTYPGTSGLVISPDGRLIAKISDSGEILLWDTTIPQQQGNFQRVEMQDSFAFHFAFRSDSNALVSVGDGNVLEWNVSSHKGPTSKVINNDYDSVLNVSPDGKLFLSDEIDGTYIYGVRSTTTGQLVTKLQTNDQLRLDIAVLSHDNKTIATYSCVEFGDASSLCIRGEINLWNADTGARLERQIKRVFTGVTSLAFDPTDEFLAISDGNLINLWDISNDQLKVTLSAADATNISAITFSPDGNILAAIASLNIVFWDLNTRQRIGQPLLGFPTLALTFSPDGKILASLDDAGHILLWDVDLHSWVTKSCQRAGRNLTRTEWEQYMLDIRYPTDRKDATCPQWPLDGETTTIPTP